MLAIKLSEGAVMVSMMWACNAVTSKVIFLISRKVSASNAVISCVAPLMMVVRPAYVALTLFSAIEFKGHMRLTAESPLVSGRRLAYSGASFEARSSSSARPGFARKRSVTRKVRKRAISFFLLCK